jgi:hypothetical protein
MKKIHLIGIRTRGLPAYSIVPQPTTVPKIKFSVYLIKDHTMEMYWEGGDICPHTLNSALDVDSQLDAPAALIQGKAPLVPIGEKAGWAPEPVWTLWGRETPVTPSEIYFRGFSCHSK